MLKFFLFFPLLLLLISSCNRPIDVIQNDNIPPAVPSGVRVFEATDGEVGIEWNGNSDLDLKGYNIYRRTDNTKYSLISFTTNNYIIDDSLDYNITYYYQITALTSSDIESSPSIEVSAEPVNKYKPFTIQYININARNWEDSISIFLSWTPSTETDIAGYNIYRSINPSFSADSTTIVAFSNQTNYSDTTDLFLYTEYFYKIRAVDKGGLIGDESPSVSDRILEIPQVIFPKNNSIVPFFNNIILKAIKVPADYKIILQTNEFFGEIWSTTISTSVTNDSLKILFNPDYISTDQYYYWRIITYTQNNSEPNSISRLYKFIIKQ